MKYLICVLLVLSPLFGQNIELGSGPFKEYMLYYFDLNDDGQIDEVEAQWVTKIECVDLGLTELPDLSSFENLGHLDVSFNRLEQLDVKDFFFLNTISGRYNRFSQMPELPWQINTVDFSGNALKAVSGLDQFFLLHEVKLADNFFESVPDLKWDFSDYPFPWPRPVQDLFLSFNLIRSVSLSQSKSVDLFLDHNRLQNIPDLPETLQSLRLRFNNIQTLPPLQHLEYLMELNCDHNQLNALPELPNGLFYLSIGHNHIGNALDFSGMKNLSYFFAPHMDLTHVPLLPDADETHGQLHVVYLYNNAFGMESCDAINKLFDRNLPGLFSLANGFKVFDGLILSSGAHDALPDCQEESRSGRGNADSLPGKLAIKTTMDNDHTFFTSNLPGSWDGFAVVNPNDEDVLITITGTNSEKQTFSLVKAKVGSFRKLLFDKELLLREYMGHIETIRFNVADPVSIQAICGLHHGRVSHSPSQSWNTFGVFYNHPGYYSRTMFHLFSEVENEIHMTLLDSNGLLLGSGSISVDGARQVNLLELGNLFDVTQPWQISTLLWESQHPVLFAKNALVEESPNYTIANVTTHVQMEGSFPVFQNSGYYSRNNGILVFNPNHTEVRLNIKGYDKLGELAEDQLFILKPLETRIMPQYLVFFQAASVRLATWASSKPIHVFLDVFRMNSGPPQFTRHEAFKSPSEYGSRFVLPHAPCNETWESELVLLNIAQTTEVEFIGRNDQGEVIEKKIVEMDSYTVKHYYLCDFFKEVEQLASVEVIAEPGASLSCYSLIETRSRKGLVMSPIPPLLNPE